MTWLPMRSPIQILAILSMVLGAAGFPAPARAIEDNGASVVFIADRLKLHHPGTILMVEQPGGTETRRPISEVPLARQFVFFKDGKETDRPELADTAIPIVRVVAIFSEDHTKLLEIQEFGPNGQSLRRTYGPR